MSGYFAFITAAALATNGLACDVPLKLPYPLMHVLAISVPGAAMSTFVIP